MKNIFIFDVEATDLYGVGFCVAAIVATQKGEIIDQFCLMSIESISECCDFVKTKVYPALKDIPCCDTNKELREKFFNFYMKYKECQIWSDVNFPVETKFLHDVVLDDTENRMWNMPYPLLDMSTIVNVNIDRHNEYKRDNPDKKLMMHNPLDDCKASLHCLLKFFGTL